MSRSAGFLSICGASLAPLLVVGLALAAEPDASGATSKPLDEGALVQYALSHNLELRAARFQQGVADAAVTRAGTFENPVARAEWLHTQSPADYGFGLGVEWTPPQPGVFGARQDAARFSAGAVRHDLQERAADLEASVRHACAELRTLDAELVLAERAVTTRWSLAEAVARRVERGAATRIDLSLVRVSLARAEQQRDELSLTREARRGQLTVSLGLPASQGLNLGPPPSDLLAANGPTATTSVAHDHTELTRQALAQRPTLHADGERARAADRTVSAERAKRWPWLSLGARYRHHDQSTYSNDVTLGLEVTLPVFNHNSAGVAAAEAEQQRQRALLLAHRAEVERDVELLSWERERRARIADHYAQTIEPVLREHRELVVRALSGMDLDLTALLAAEDMVAQSSIEYLRARLAERQTEISLARALGRYGQGAVLETQ